MAKKPATNITNYNTTGPALTIHGGPSVESLNASRDAVVAVLNTPAADAAKVEALKALGAMHGQPTTISHCHFAGASIDTGERISVDRKD
jgi:hypothetical protein